MQVDASTFSCKTKSGTNTLDTAVCNLDTTSIPLYFIVTMVAPCKVTCAGGTPYTVQFSGVKNPEWIGTITKSIEIQTMTSDLLWIKDRKISGVITTPELTEGVISDGQITKVGSIVNQPTDLTIEFTTVNKITANGIIRVFLPSSGFYLPKTGAIACTDIISAGSGITCKSSLYADQTKGIQYIEINGKCPTACAVGTKMSFRIANI